MGLLLHVLGTDTGVGKTVVTAGLARALAAAGHRVAVAKPFATGPGPRPGVAEDTARLAAALPGTDTAAVTAWSAEAPLAPRVAAARTGQPVPVADVAAAVRARAADVDLLLVEGIGGVCTPLAPGVSYLDFVAGLGGSAIVVARPGLGTLNHTALTVRACLDATLPVLGVVCAHTAAGGADLAVETNPGALAESLPVPVWPAVPHLRLDGAGLPAAAPFTDLAARVAAALLSTDRAEGHPTHDVLTRVRYQETDQMGVVYHANYLVWFELGRTSLLRALGLPYSDLERDGIRLAVADASVRYIASARYDERVRIHTALAEVGRASLAFRYEVSRIADGVRLAEGRTTLACLDAAGRPRRLPAHAAALLGAARPGPVAAPVEAQA